MDRKKRKINRLSDGVARLYRQESADELFPEPPTARPSAPARPSEDPTAQFTGYFSPEQEERRRLGTEISGKLRRRILARSCRR